MLNTPLERLSAAESAACVRGSGTCAQRCSWLKQKSYTRVPYSLAGEGVDGAGRSPMGTDGESQGVGDGVLPALPAPRAEASISVW